MKRASERPKGAEASKQANKGPEATEGSHGSHGSKQSKERRKTIFDFNHIDPALPKERLEEIEKLYATYKRMWWCFKKLHQKQKRLDLVEKIVSSVLVAGGVVAGGATLNPIVLGVISGLGLIVKISGSKKQGKKRLRKLSLRLQITKKHFQL